MMSSPFRALSTPWIRCVRYAEPTRGRLLKRQDAAAGRKGPAGHIKTRLQLLFPLEERISGLGEQMRGGCEHPRTALQLFSAHLAAVLALGYRVRTVPQLRKLTAAVSCRLGKQGANRQPPLWPIQPSLRTFAQGTQPSMQRCVIWMSRPHPPHRSPQRDVWKLRVTVHRTACLNDLARIVLERGDLYRKHAHTAPTYRTAAQRNRCRPILHASGPRPVRPPLHPDGRVDQLPNGPALRADSFPANAFALDSAPP
jgi:hypothetical protein